MFDTLTPRSTTGEETMPGAHPIPACSCRKPGPAHAKRCPHEGSGGTLRRAAERHHGLPGNPSRDDGARAPPPASPSREHPDEREGQPRRFCHRNHGRNADVPVHPGQPVVHTSIPPTDGLPGSPERASSKTRRPANGSRRVTRPDRAGLLAAALQDPDTWRTSCRGTSLRALQPRRPARIEGGSSAPRAVSIYGPYSWDSGPPSRPISNTCVALRSPSGGLTAPARNPAPLRHHRLQSRPGQP